MLQEKFILVIDDSVIIQQTTSLIISKFGFVINRIHTSSNASDAVKLCQIHRHQSQRIKHYQLHKNVFSTFKSDGIQGPRRALQQATTFSPPVEQMTTKGLGHITTC